jgi:hypothetical protein
MAFGYWLLAIGCCPLASGFKVQGLGFSSTFQLFNFSTTSMAFGSFLTSHFFSPMPHANNGFWLLAFGYWLISHFSFLISHFSLLTSSQNDTPPQKQNWGICSP